MGRSWGGGVYYKAQTKNEKNIIFYKFIAAFVTFGCYVGDNPP